jgi:hypothetical protein
MLEPGTDGDLEMIADISPGLFCTNEKVIHDSPQTLERIQVCKAWSS